MECLECERLAIQLRLATMDCAATDRNLQACAADFFVSKGLLSDSSIAQWMGLYDRLNEAQFRKQEIEARYRRHRVSHGMPQAGGDRRLTGRAG